MAKGLPEDVIKGPLSDMLRATDRAKLAQTRKRANKMLQPKLKKEKKRSKFMRFQLRRAAGMTDHGSGYKKKRK